MDRLSVPERSRPMGREGRRHTLQVTDELYLTYVQRQKLLGNLVRQADDFAPPPTVEEEDGEYGPEDEEGVENYSDESVVSLLCVLYITVKLGWRELWRLVVLLLRWLWNTLCLLRYVNPVHYVLQWRRQAMVIDRDGKILYKPGLIEIFTSVAARQRHLLEWVQELLPTFQVSNLTSTWSDGVALCALLEAICPGACPRYDLLKPQNKVNNCRLGLKLANKHLNITQTLITPEEMALALPGSDSEVKMKQLLTLIKWMSYNQPKVKPATDHLHNLHTKASATAADGKGSQRLAEPCTAKGTGLVAGVVGKMCKFNVFINAPDKLDLHVSIKGPNGEMCSEKIMSLEQSSNSPQGVRRPSLLSPTESRGSIWEIGSRSVRFWKQPNGGMPIVRERSMDIDESNGHKVEKIPFDYQCISEGHFVITYIPRSSGLHNAHVKWHTQDIKGSPYNIKIVDSIEELNKQPRGGRILQRKVSFDTKNGRMKFYPQESVDSVSSEKSEGKSDEKDQALILSKKKQIHRQLGAALRISKQATITRRRVLRRVITKAGQEIVIHEAPPSPSPVENIPPSGDMINPGELPARQGSPAPQKVTTKGGFDFDYDSDNSSRPGTPSNETPQQHAERIANAMVDSIMSGVFKTIEQSGYLKDNDSNDVQSNEESIPEPKRKDSLQPPLFDANFRGSPFVNDGLVKPVPIKASTDNSDASGQEEETILILTEGRVLSTTSTPMNPSLSFDSQLYVPKDGTRFRSSPFARSNSPFDRGKNEDSESVTSDTDSFTSGSNVKRTNTTKYKFSTSSSASETGSMQIDSVIPPDIHIEINDRASAEGMMLSQNNSLSDPDASRAGSTSDSSDTKSDINQIRVRTQLRDSRPRSRRGSSENTLSVKKTSVKKTLSDPLSRKRRVRSPAPERANTTPASPIHGLVRQRTLEEQTIVTRSQSDSPSLKVLQSESLNKACFYISQRAFESMGSMKSQTSIDPPNKEEDLNQYQHEKDVSNFVNSTDRPMLVNQKSKQKLRLSRSLPTLSKSRTAFEYDPDDDCVTLSDMQDRAAHAQNKHKRMTLGSSDLSRDIDELMQRNADLKASDLELPSSQWLNKLTAPDTDDLDEMDYLDVADIEQFRASPIDGSPRLSPLGSNSSGSPTGSNKNSRRGSLVRQDVISLKKVSEEDSLDTDKSESIDQEDKENNLPYSLPVQNNDHISVTVNGFEISGSQNVPLKVPKAKIDRCTQVSYDEIKKETCWERPTLYVRHRRMPIKPASFDDLDNESIQQPSKILGEKDTNRRTTDSQIKVYVQNVYSKNHLQSRNGSTSSSNGTGIHSPREHASPLLGPDQNGDQVQPVRQSTVETIDSGIADDSSPQCSLSPRHSTDAALIPLRPTTRYLNGHRVVARRHYRKQVSIDSRLIKNNSPTTSHEDNKDNMSSEQHRINKRSSLSRLNRTLSETQKWKVPSREDSGATSLSEGIIDKKKSAKRTGKRSIIGSHRRRVTFSRRVMMYRRSSSRSSKRSSRESKESKDSLQSPKSSFQAREQVQCDHDSKAKEQSVIKDNVSALASYLSLSSRAPRHKKKIDVENWISQTSRGSLCTSSVDEPGSPPNDDPKHKCWEKTNDADQYQETVYPEVITNTIQNAEGTQVQEGPPRISDDLLSVDDDTSNSQVDSEKRGGRDAVQSGTCDTGRVFGVNLDNIQDFLSELDIFSNIISDQSSGTDQVHSVRTVLPNVEGRNTSSGSETCSEVARITAGVYRENSIASLRSLPSLQSLSDDPEIAELLYEALGMDYSVPQVPDQGSNIQVGVTTPIEEDLRSPKPNNCVVCGTGISCALVGIKNNFQVQTDGAGSGTLTVGVTGPRPHTVTETNVTYTGDNLYEVIYEVTHPGYYIIHIKWSECNIPGSPFVCKATF